MADVKCELLPGWVVANRDYKGEDVISDPFYTYKEALEYLRSISAKYPTISYELYEMKAKVFLQPPVIVEVEVPCDHHPRYVVKYPHNDLQYCTNCGKELGGLNV